MCWSGEASAAVAVIGIGAAGYVAYKKDSPLLWVPLLYFALIEILQAISYLVIDQCDAPLNQTVTYLSYLHTVFQPFFVNAMYLYFIPNKVRKKIQIPVYMICFLVAIAMLVRMYPFEWSGLCKTEGCGPVFCSVSGVWHISWEFALNNIFILPRSYPFPFNSPYWLAFFILPLLYGSWRVVVFAFVLGPLLAAQFTTQMGEHSAIWCSFAVALVMAQVFNPVRRHLHVRKWVLWPKAWRE